MKKLGLVLAVLVCAWLLGSCGGNSSLSDSALSANGHSFAATEDTPLVCELIAGAGQGWPGTGIDVGQVEVWNDGDNLHVTYVLDAEGWYFGDDSLHLWVGKDAPEPPVAPGQFPFKGTPDQADSEYEFVLPLEGFYPAHGNEDPVAYDWTEADLYIAAHGVVCSEVDGGELPVSGVFATWTLVYGATFEEIGWVTLAIDGNNLVVTIHCDPPWTMTETQLYLGLTPPNKLAPGSWPYQHTGLAPGTTNDTYTIPLNSIPAGPGDTVYIAIHAVVVNSITGASETAMSWDDDNNAQWKENNWKRYSWFEVPDGSGEPGEPYEICETMWGLDWNLGGDGVSANEPGWFPTFYDFAVKKWGWLFTYSTELPE